MTKIRLFCKKCNHTKSYHSLGSCSKFVNELNRTCRCKANWKTDFEYEVIG